MTPRLICLLGNWLGKEVESDMERLGPDRDGIAGRDEQDVYDGIEVNVCRSFP